MASLSEIEQEKDHPQMKPTKNKIFKLKSKFGNEKKNLDLPFKNTKADKTTRVTDISRGRRNSFSTLTEK